MVEKLDATDLRLRLILIVERLAKASPTGLAAHGEIIGEMMDVEDATLGSAKRLLNRVWHRGWLERPFYGCYRLATEAYEILEDAGVEV